MPLRKTREGETADGEEVPQEEGPQEQQGKPRQASQQLTTTSVAYRRQSRTDEEGPAPPGDRAFVVRQMLVRREV